MMNHKNDESQKWIYSVLLTEMNNLDFIKNDLDFLKKLSTSINVQNNPKNFIEYLKIEYYKNLKLGDRIFEVLNNFIVNNNQDIKYYHERQTIEFIFELYSRSKFQNQNKFLDLIDNFLINDGYRNSVQGLIE